MLLERQSPLASLTEYAAEAALGSGRLVLLSAEAGGGKSALVEQLSAQLTDARWLWAACDGLFTPRPLGLLTDLAPQLGGELLELSRAHAPRDDLFGALLSQLNEPGVLTVLVLEDLHWADEASLDLLRFIGRRLRASAVLLIATYRAEGVTTEGPLRVALGELASQSSTRRLGLAPLSEEAVAELAEGTGLDAAELYRLTSGNPFFVVQVVSSGMDSVPPSARDAVLAHVARLTVGARAAVEIAAMAGRRIDPRLLEELSPDFVSAADELVSSQLVVDDGTELSFRHEIARLAVEQTIPSHRRQQVHARILESLRRLGSTDDARLAFHAEAARDATAVIEYSVRAARSAAALSSHREAEAQWARAIRFGAGLPAHQLAEIYEGYSEEVSVLDRWDDSAEAASVALALRRETGDRRHEGDLLRRISRIMWRLCRGAESRGTAEEAIRVLEPLGDSVELASAYDNLANQLANESEANPALTWAVRARQLGERLGIPAVVSDALNTEACARAVLNDEWLDILLRALALAKENGLQSQVGRAYTNLVGISLDKRMFPQAEHYSVEGLAYCDERDMSTYVTCLLGSRTNILHKRGDWDAVLTLTTDLLARKASPINHINALCSRAGVLSGRGSGGEFVLLDRAVASADGTNEPEWIVMARLARAHAYLLDGRADEARQDVERTQKMSDRLDEWMLGAVDAAARRVGITTAGSGKVAEPYRRARLGDFGGAAEAWLALDCVLDAAWTLSDSATERNLRESLRLFESVGATAAARFVRGRMRDLGIRTIPAGPRAATRANPSGLTPRESEVLELLALGSTNADIAAALYISTKTVDHHVSSVLAKLGTATRTGAAAEAVRLGLLPIT